MNAYSINLIRDDQVAQAKALMSSCFEAKLASIFYLHPESTLVVTYFDRVVAGINLDVYRVNKQVKMGYIGWLYTDEKHRGKALAGLLLTEAMAFLEKQGCTEVSACVEGDNPASFKQLANRGFSILGLWQQLRRFGFGTPVVYRHASRFFDMGYFLWHKSLIGDTGKEAAVGAKALVLTLVGNTLLFLFSLMGWNLLGLSGFHPFPLSNLQHPVLLLATPSLFLLGRTLAMLIWAKIKKREVVYRSWDTAWIAAILLSLGLGLPFPVPGNLYVKGIGWKLKEETPLLAMMAILGQVAVAALCLVVPKGVPLLFGLCLVTLDTLFFFYPFCGFNASRVKRWGKKPFAISVVVLLAVLLSVLVY